MINALIVDDEHLACETMRNLLHEYCPEVELAGIAHNAEEAKNHIEYVKPDIVFLDIELNHHSGNGFDLLCSLPDEQKDFSVVFTTGHEHYAYHAMKMGCIDFLIKPIDIDHLRSAVRKAREAQEIRYKTKLLRNFTEFLAIMNRENLIDRIPLPYENGIRIVSFREINYCKSAHNHTIFALLTGEHLYIAKPLSDYEGLLTEHGFMNIHKGVYVNLRNIECFQRVSGESTSGEVTFYGGAKTEVSRRKKEELIDRLRKLYQL